MSQQVLEANIAARNTWFYPTPLSPKLAEIAPGDVWRIMFEYDQPVAIYRIGEYAIVGNGLSGYAYQRSLDFGGRNLFETTFENVRKLADLIIHQHALVLADDDNEMTAGQPEVKREFSNQASWLRANLACQRIELVNQIANANR